MISSRAPSASSDISPLWIFDLLLWQSSINKTTFYVNKHPGPRQDRTHLKPLVFFINKWPCRTTTGWATWWTPIQTQRDPNILNRGGKPQVNCITVKSGHCVKSKDAGPEDPTLVIPGGDLVYCNLNGSRGDGIPALRTRLWLSPEGI